MTTPNPMDRWVSDGRDLHNARRDRHARTSPNATPLPEWDQLSLVEQSTYMADAYSTAIRNGEVTDNREEIPR